MIGRGSLQWYSVFVESINLKEDLVANTLTILGHLSSEFEILGKLEGRGDSGPRHRKRQSYETEHDFE